MTSGPPVRASAHVSPDRRSPSLHSRPQVRSQMVKRSHRQVPCLSNNVSQPRWLSARTHPARNSIFPAGPVIGDCVRSIGLQAECCGFETRSNHRSMHGRIPNDATLSDFLAAGLELRLDQRNASTRRFQHPGAAGRTNFSEMKETSITTRSIGSGSDSSSRTFSCSLTMTRSFSRIR